MTTSCYGHYNIHDLLTVSSNAARYVPDYFSVPRLRDPDLLVSFSGAIPQLVSKNMFTEVAPGLRFYKDNESVTSTVNLLGFKAAWSLTRLLGRPTEVYLNRAYMLLSKTLLMMPISTVFPDHAFIQMVIHVKLLRKRHTFLVGACFEHGESPTTTVISSMGGMGKTTLVLEVLKKLGGNYISDDMVIVNEEGTVYSYPKAIRIRRVSIPPVAVETYILPKRILGSNSRITRVGKVGNVILLERATRNEVRTLSLKEVLSKILIINRKLLPYYIERSMLAYSYMDPSFNLYEFMQTEAEILCQFLKYAKCYALRVRPGSLESCVELLRDVVNERT